MLRLREIRQKTNNLFSCFEKSEVILLPFAIFSGGVLLLSYLCEFVWGNGFTSLVGSNALSRILSGLYGLLSDLFPIIAGLSIVGASGEKGAIPAAVGAGAVCTRGYSFLSPQGSIDAACGIWGAILSGLLGILSYKLMRKLLNSQNPEFHAEILSSLCALIISISFAYIFTNFASALGYLTTSLMGMLIENELLLCILLALLLGFNPGGASYVGVFAFSKAVFSADSSIVFAVMLSAAMVPQLAVSIASLVFREKHSDSSRKILPFCLIFALAGINTVALSRYVKHPLSHGLSYCAGGVVSAVLCYLFGCGAQRSDGGLFSIGSAEKPLLIIASAFAGGVAGAVIIGLFGKKNQVHSAPDD